VDVTANVDKATVVCKSVINFHSVATIRYVN
jgi:hypothetical protein